MGYGDKIGVVQIDQGAALVAGYGRMQTDDAGVIKRPGQDKTLVQVKVAIEGAGQGQAVNEGIIAGVDMAFDRKSQTAFATVVVLRYPSFRPIAVKSRSDFVRMPYVPGYLSFREAPLLLELLAEIDAPDLLMLDGQGIAHPRGLGLASHIGLFVDIPTIGCAKSRLIGTYVEPGLKAGQREYLWHNEKKIGVVLRTRDGVRPIFVSPGHRIDIDNAAEWAFRCVDRYRIPIPTRMADIEVAKFKKGLKNEIRN